MRIYFSCMHITFETYRLMSRKKQAEVLWLKGVHLDLTRKTRTRIIVLYALFDFYVEIFFDAATEDPISLKAFTQTRQLKPYLEKIRIDDVFQFRNWQ